MTGVRLSLVGIPGSFEARSVYGIFTWVGVFYLSRDGRLISGIAALTWLNEATPPRMGRVVEDVMLLSNGRVQQAGRGTVYVK